MRTIKRQPNSVTTDTQDVKSLAKYFHQMEYKGILEDDNIYAIDQQSFRDAENVYVDWNERLVSRPTLQASNEEQEYDIVEKVVYGDVTVEARYYNDTYTIVATKGTQTDSITGLTKYKLAHIEHYIICFNNVNAEVLDTVKTTFGWEYLSEYGELPVINRYVGTIHNSYDGNLNMFTPNSYLDEYEWTRQIQTVLPAIKLNAPPYYLVQKIEITGDTDTYEYNTLYSDTVKEAADYRFIRPINITAYETHPAHTSPSIAEHIYDGKKELTAAGTNTGVSLCKSHSTYFEYSANGGKAFTKVWYPSYTGTYTNIASISEDGEYFFFVTTDGVYRCNLGDLSWTKFMVDNDAIIFDQYSRCQSYCFKTGEIFAFYIINRASAYVNATGRLYMKGPGLYSGDDYTDDYSHPTEDDQQHNYKFSFIDTIDLDTTESYAFLGGTDTRNTSLGHLSVTDRGPDATIFPYACDITRSMFISVSYDINGKPITSIAFVTGNQKNASNDYFTYLCYIRGGDTSYITGRPIMYAAARTITFVDNMNNIALEDIIENTPTYVKVNDENYISAFNSSISCIINDKTQNRYVEGKIDISVNAKTAITSLDRYKWEGRKLFTSRITNIFNATISFTDADNVSYTGLYSDWESTSSPSNGTYYITDGQNVKVAEVVSIDYSTPTTLNVKWLDDKYRNITFANSVSATTAMINWFSRNGILYVYQNDEYVSTALLNIEFTALKTLPIIDRVEYTLPYMLGNGYIFGGKVMAADDEKWYDIHIIEHSNFISKMPLCIVDDTFYIPNLITNNDLAYRIFTNNLFNDDIVKIQMLHSIDFSDGTLNSPYDIYAEVPDVVYSDTDIYLGKDKTLQITENSKHPMLSTRIRFYLPAKNNQSFIENITALQNISTTEIAIFFKDAIKICAIIEDSNVVDTGYRYEYYNTKLSTGVRLGDDVINTLEGTYTIFPTRRGLAAMNYQAFMATTDQSIEYLTDNVIDMWTKFYDDSRTIKIIQWRNRLLFTNQTGSILIFDLVTKAWWRWTVPVNVRSMLTDQLTLQLINMPIVELQDAGTGRIMTFEEVVDEQTLRYYDFSKTQRLSNDNRINWFMMSQPLHMSMPQYYKNLKQLVFQFSESNDPDLIVEKSINAQIKLYRKTITIREPEVVNFKIENLRTFVKRFNYWKINEVQWALGNDADSSTPHKFELNGISIKYELGEEVR